MNYFDVNENPKLKAALPYIRNVYTSLFASLTALLFSYIVLSGYIGTYLAYEIDLSFPVKVFFVLLLPIVMIAVVAAMVLTNQAVPAVI